MGQSIFLDVLPVAGVFVLMVVFVIYQVQKGGWLKRHGRRIVAVVTSIQHETGKTPAGFARDNYYVTATWTNPRTGRTYTFWTWIMNSCPAFTKGSLVSVLIDPHNPKRFTMDL